MLAVSAPQLWAQQREVIVAAGISAPAIYGANEMPALPMSPVLPRMSPELALQRYLQRAQRQLTDLGYYSDRTVVEADLPSTKQRGRYELLRTFTAPKSLVFSAKQFIGDNFVKSNVIVRLLEAEVDSVKKAQGPQLAINDANYKFKLKASERLNGNAVYAFEVKPRRKRSGLFKGRVYVDAYTGSIRRAEGVMVKSPSFFIKKIEFVQDYADFDGFSLPVHIHSDTRARIIGRALVDVYHSDYQPRPVTDASSQEFFLSPTGSN